MFLPIMYRYKGNLIMPGQTAAAFIEDARIPGYMQAA